MSWQAVALVALNVTQVCVLAWVAAWQKRASSLAVITEAKVDELVAANGK